MCYTSQPKKGLQRLQLHTGLHLKAVRNAVQYSAAGGVKSALLAALNSVHRPYRLLRPPDYISESLV